MNKIKKDIPILYMLRNFLGTFIVVFFAFMFALIQYYQCSFIEVLRRIFINDIFTVSYFMLMWLFDYLIFEISKILYDLYKNQFNTVIIVIIGLCSIISLFIPIATIMQYNLCLLILLIDIRMIKQIIKKTRTGLKLKKQDEK